MDMKLTFETQALRVMIEDMSQAGSAFGSAENGDGVFFNHRMVARMKLDIGDVVEAHVIPNYEDKRLDIPWRAVRVVVEDVVVAEVVPEPPAARTPDQLDADILKILAEVPDEHWTSSEIARHVDAEMGTTVNACARLFNAGRLAKADVFAGPGQSRASFCLWALTTDVFR